MAAAKSKKTTLSASSLYKAKPKKSIWLEEQKRKGKIKKQPTWLKEILNED
jgi:hypothetical protein